MGRALCALVAAMTFACASAWKSRVTLVRPTGCDSRIGDSCIYTYETVSVERPGRCASQQVMLGERLVGCREYTEHRGVTIATVAVIVVVPLAMAAVLGFFAIADPASY